MARTRRRWSERERRELLAVQAESGLSLWGFAAAAGVPYTTLVSWRQRAAARPRFVPVEVESAGPPLPSGPAHPAGDGGVHCVEVVVGDVVVRIGTQTDDALLARVVRVLRTC